MATIIFEDGLCFTSSATPTVIGATGATRQEWRVAEKPTGSTVSFSDLELLEPEITFSQDGEYELELCTYFDSGSVVVDPALAQEAELNCPKAVLAGQLATVYLRGCTNGQISNVVFSGAATSASFNAEGEGTVTTSAVMTGAATISLDCTTFAADGTPTVTAFSCDFEVLDANTPITPITVAQADDSEFILCGETCICNTVIVTVDCNETVCETAQVGLVFRECPDNLLAEECQPLEQTLLIGNQLTALHACNNTLDDCLPCEEDICCDEDEPALFWNNLFNCSGWTVTGDAAEGSSVYNAASCNAGQKLCFNGSTTLTFSGPPTKVDALIIWGHNISDGLITVSPLTTVSGSSVSLGIINDGACIGGYTAPVIVNFTDTGAGLVVTDFTLTIEANSGGLVCIEQIFIGEQVFLPDDRLPATFLNPHDGTDIQTVALESNCGNLGFELERVAIPLELSIPCANRDWLIRVWRPFIRYAQRHGFYFQHSRNLQPTDVFYGWIDGVVPPSTYNEMGDNTVTLNGRGFITQNQPKELV